jgi:excisionase family DNA binding protein
MADREGLLTPKEAALYLKLNPRTVIRLAREGKIPAIKVGNRWRFEPDALAESFERPGKAGLDRERHLHRPSKASIASCMRPDLVITRLKAATRREALEEMVSLLSEAGVLSRPEEFLDLLLEREDLMSTAIVDGVAIPHPRRSAPGMFAESLVVVAISKSGVDFGAAGGVPVRLFLMICAKDDRSHLQILSLLSQTLSNTPLAQRLMNAVGPEAVIQAVAREEGSAGVSRSGAA